MGVREPARAEIPAAFGRCANIPEHLRGLPPTGAGEIDVLAIRLVAWSIAFVPIAVENRTVVERDHVMACGARAQPFGALHPECVLGLQLRQIAYERRRWIVVGEQSDHFEKKRRLRAAQVIGARAVRDVSVGVDQVGEVIDHVLREVAALAFDQAQHREIGIPVIDLTKAAARDDIGTRQRQQRGVRRGRIRAAGERVPQPVDVLADRDPFGRRGGSNHLLGQCKMPLDEARERRGRLRVGGVVLREDHLRCFVRHRVRKGLAVLVDRFGLDGGEQILEQHLRRLRILRRATPWRLRQTDGQQRQEERHGRHGLGQHRHHTRVSLRR